MLAVLGPGVGVATRAITDAAPVWPEEAAAMARAVPERRAEFAAGRACIRDAMANLGVAGAAVPMGPDRAPIWPGGLVGSLAHGAGFCIAAVARDEAHDGLGVDIEPDDPLPADVAREALSPDEARLPEASHRAIFCAKEAVYKAFYRKTRTIWGFDAVTIALSRDGLSFDAQVRAVPGHPDVHGHILRDGRVIVTAVLLPRRK